MSTPLSSDPPARSYIDRDGEMGVGVQVEVALSFNWLALGGTASSLVTAGILAAFRWTRRRRQWFHVLLASA